MGSLAEAQQALASQGKELDILTTYQFAANPRIAAFKRILCTVKSST
jgi:hypothetical protein